MLEFHEKFSNIPTFELDLGMSIYFDVRCLNRPFDDQTQDRIKIETDAVLIILNWVGDGLYSMVKSDVLDLEISRMPDAERRKR